MAKSTSFEDMDLPAIATHSRWVLLFIAVQIVLITGMIAVAVAAVPNPEIIVWTLWGLSSVVTVVSVVFSVLLMIAMRDRVTSMIAVTIALLLVNVLALIAMYSKGTTILKVLGVKSGFFGVSRADRERLMPRRCRQCGYDRNGLDDLLAPCPECSRVPVVW